MGRGARHLHSGLACLPSPKQIGSNAKCCEEADRPRPVELHRAPHQHTQPGISDLDLRHLHGKISPLLNTTNLPPNGRLRLDRSVPNGLVLPSEQAGRAGRKPRLRAEQRQRLEEADRSFWVRLRLSRSLRTTSGWSAWRFRVSAGSSAKSYNATGSSFLSDSGRRELVRRVPRPRIGLSPPK